ncbi:hypothetical protein SprV_0502009100 [Sparganum proliferum]
MHESETDRSPETPTTSNTPTMPSPTHTPSPSTPTTTGSTIPINEADTDTADFSCPHCPRTFTSRAGLVGHLRIQRTETDEPVPRAPTYTRRICLQCPHCTLTFMQHSGLLGPHARPRKTAVDNRRLHHIITSSPTSISSHINITHCKHPTATSHATALPIVHALIPTTATIMTALTNSDHNPGFPPPTPTSSFPQPPRRRHRQPPLPPWPPTQTLPTAAYHHHPLHQRCNSVLTSPNRTFPSRIGLTSQSQNHHTEHQCLEYRTRLHCHICIHKGGIHCSIDASCTSANSPVSSTIHSSSIRAPITNSTTSTTDLTSSNLSYRHCYREFASRAPAWSVTCEYITQKVASQCLEHQHTPDASISTALTALARSPIACALTALVHARSVSPLP